MEVRPGYKQTEIGVVPETWKICSLGTICDVRDGTHESPRFFATGVPFVTSKNIVDGRLDLEDVSYISEADAVEFNKRSKVDRNDILMSMIGTIGSAALIESEPDFCIKNVALLKPRRVEPSFLIHLINSPLFQQYLAENLDGGIQKFVSLGTLRQLAIPVPDESEQRAIAAALSDVDALLGGLERLIAKKRGLKQAAMQQLLTGQTRLPGFSGEWEVKRLGDVADVIDPHPSHRAPDEMANGVPFVGIGDLDERGSIVGKNVRRVSPVVLEEHALRYDLKDELIGLGRVASIGKVVSLKNFADGYAISPTLGVIRGREAKRSYLLYELKSRFVTEQFTKIMSGSTRSSVGMEVLRELHVRLPSSEQEQTAIAAVLSDMDTELAALEARRDKTRALKQAMMQELLTGKIRLI